MAEHPKAGVSMTKNEILRQARKENRSNLTEIESKEIIKSAGIPVVEARLARTKVEAVTLSKKMGFPAALKIVSPDIVHKSDAGGVKLDLANAVQVGKAYSEILSAIKKRYPKAKIEGISVQKMASPGVELIIGMTKDAQFGPVLMFGLGGILVEVLKDVSFRIVPLTKRDASQMIREIKGYPLIDKNPEIKELDLNPVFAYKDGAVAVDARVILEPTS
jgi:acyl-CoA synthetase (NDP forming)